MLVINATGTILDIATNELELVNHSVLRFKEVRICCEILSNQKFSGGKIMNAAQVICSAKSLDRK